MSPRHVAAAAVPGLLLGFSLSRIGFGDFAEVQRMFTFSDLRLVFTFVAGVALTGAGILAYSRAHPLPRRPIHRGTVLGSIAFGVGWALSGACPSIALVQLGEGRLYGLVTLTGILLGVAAAGPILRKAGLPTDGC